MFKSITAFAAKGIIRNAETNAISVFEIIEQLSSTSFPIILQNVDFFALLTREESDPKILKSQLEITIEDTKIVTFPIDSDFMDKLRNRTVVHIEGFPIAKPGILVFNLKNSTDDSSIVSYKILVQSINKEPQYTVNTKAG